MYGEGEDTLLMNGAKLIIFPLSQFVTMFADNKSYKCCNVDLQIDDGDALYLVLG